MIKIRYLDLPTGLHVYAEAHGSDIIIYLLPGLTTAQRRAALHRARSSARMGHGPALPAAGLACAVAADRVRTTVRNGAAAMRVHPGLVIPPVVITVSAALAYLLLASVSVSVTYRPPGAGPGQQSRQESQGLQPRGVPPDLVVPTHGAARGHASGGNPGGPGRTPGSPPHPGQPPSPSPSGHGTPSPSPSPLPAPYPSPSVGPSPTPSVSATPPPPSGRPGGLGGCVTVGTLGICVHL